MDITSNCGEGVSEPFQWKDFCKFFLDRDFVWVTWSVRNNQRFVQIVGSLLISRFSLLWRPWVAWWNCFGICFFLWSFSNEVFSSLIFVWNFRTAFGLLVFAPGYRWVWKLILSGIPLGWCFWEVLHIICNTSERHCVCVMYADPLVRFRRMSFATRYYSRCFGMIYRISWIFAACICHLCLQRKKLICFESWIPPVRNSEVALPLWITTPLERRSNAKS